MRIIIFVVFLSFFAGCQKKHELGADYEKFRGFWVGNGGDQKQSIEFTNNGRVLLKNSYNRGDNFRILSLTKDYYINEKGWFLYFIESREHDKIAIFISPTYDSISSLYTTTENYTTYYQNEGCLLKVN